MENVLQQHIEITPGVVGGRPRIAGHRISVQNIVIWYDRMGQTADEIVDQHPGLTLADVHAALAYYFDHIDEINESIRADEEFVEELRKRTPSKVKDNPHARSD